MTVFKFEFLVFFRKRKNSVLLLLSIGLVVVLFIFNQLMLEKEYQEKLPSLTQDEQMTEIFFSQNPNQNLKEYLAKFDFPQSEIADIYRVHKRSLDYVTTLKNEQVIDLVIENQFIKDYSKIVQVSNSRIPKKDFISGQYLGNKSLVNNELLKENTSEESTRYGSNGVMFVNFMLQFFCSIYGVAFLLFLFGSVFSENSQDYQIRLIFTEPIKRKRYFNQSLLFTLLMSLSFILIIVIFSLILGTILGGVGNFDYPIFINSLDGGMFIPIWQYWLWLLASFIPVFIYFILCFFLCVLLMRNGVAALLTSVGINFGLFKIFTIIPLTKLDFLNPFIYLNPRLLQTAIDYQPQHFVSAGYSNGQYHLDSQLFLTNTSYFEGYNLQVLLDNQHISFLSCFVSITISILGLKLVLNRVIKQNER